MQASNEPYVGPRPFEQSDRAVFFGRTQEANELVSLLTAHAAVLLYSQSGAGKTSLVKAGLIPLLVDEEKFNVLPPMRVKDNGVACLKPKGSTPTQDGTGPPHATIGEIAEFIAQ